MIHSSCVTRFAVAFLILITIGSDAHAGQVQYQTNSEKIQAFNEHLKSLQGKHRQEPVDYLVGDVYCREPETKIQIRRASGYVPSVVSVSVDTRNVDYVRLRFFSGEMPTVSLTEDNRKNCIDLLSKAKRWFRESTVINATVTKTVGNIPCLYRGLSMSTEKPVNLQLVFVYKKDQKNLKQRGAIQFELAGPIIKHDDKISKTSEVFLLELFFSPEEDCSVDTLISLLREGPNAAANSLDIERQLK